MTTTPEGKVKAKVHKILDLYTPVWYVMPVMGGYGAIGIPDFLCCVNGMLLGIECKAGKNKLTPMQEAIRVKILAAGGEYMMVNENNLIELGYTLGRLGAVQK
jgi:hypothetical protein